MAKKTAKKIVLAMLVFLMTAGSAGAGEVPVNLDTEKMTEIPNAVQLEANLVAGGPFCFFFFGLYSGVNG